MYFICKKRILLEVWKEEFKELESDLRQAASRGVNVTIIAYVEIASDFANVYLHYMGHEFVKSMVDDGLLLVQMIQK